MTTYRVGAEGAVVFDPKTGKAISTLPPGCVVVEGLRQDTARASEPSKRLGRYSDKKIRPEEDKA